MIYLVDTNVLLRFANRTHPLHATVRTAMRRLRNEGHQLQVVSQNCVELARHFYIDLHQEGFIYGDSLSPNP